MLTEFPAKLCVRPIPRTGPVWLWTRAGRDDERKHDQLRCRCGGEECRDREVMGEGLGREHST